MGQWNRNTIILPNDRFRLHPEHTTDFTCPFDYCEFTTFRKDKLDKHVEVCTNTTNIQYRQEKMTDKTKVLDFLIENNYIDSEFQNKNFMVIDIESFGSKDSAREISELTAVVSEQKIVTVAFSKNFGLQSDRTVCFRRESMSHEHYLAFYRKICHYLKLSCLEYFRSLPTSILDNISKLERHVKEFKNEICLLICI